MRKLRLSLENLAVESFETTRPEAGRGTVHAEQACTCVTYCTCPGMATCGDLTCPVQNTCNDTCEDTCDNWTCLVTCGFSNCETRCGTTCRCQ